MNKLTKEQSKIITKIMMDNEELIRFKPKGYISKIVDIIEETIGIRVSNNSIYKRLNQMKEKRIMINIINNKGATVRISRKIIDDEITIDLRDNHF